MTTTIHTLREQLDSLLDALDESQLQQTLQYVRGLRGNRMGDPRALIEWANSLSPQAREASKEVARILEEEHAREMWTLESAE